MKKLIVGSINKSAGKTSFIVGLGKALGKSVGYMKPFGDRLLYKKKRLWDYDSALVTDVFGLRESPEEMSIGFEHAKLRYMYDKEQTKKKLDEMANYAGGGKDVLFVEGPENLACGVSIHLDVISVAKDLGGKLVFVVSGSEDTVIDHITFISKFVDTTNVELAGVVINKVQDVEDFKNTYLDFITHTGIKVLGVLPYQRELGLFSVDFLADGLFSKILAGESGLKKTVTRVFVGAMSADVVVKEPWFVKEENKLVITSGDRTDMIVASLETGAAAIVLTNNILPPPKIIAKASDLGVPLLQVSGDTFQIAKQVDDMEPLLSRSATEKVDLLAEMVKNNCDFDALSL
jgi:BioD-like phosphotransacetylase family protein